ncbi:MAG TPA: hypothetical protein DEB17_04925 [Chlorobaculum sp.]|uniref:Uncharacterized protein n=1 Tax=Chlorobaculum tepidum (strain ATCC 49652 / DSM 12025 / NBRC 103806 / TLS) TaxID=194439 RepID=Q8KB02_CHLTE|nr:hypothetical protein CT1996 [Chlorobaculum tepidum TLS]HBU23328.1 hypothetical protein [Chlorobaculum sp.]
MVSGKPSASGFAFLPACPIPGKGDFLSSRLLFRPNKTKIILIY